jgi:hypothetical protein
MENQETINKLRRIYKESTNETAKAGAKAKLQQMGVSLTDEKPKSDLSQEAIDKLRRIYKESTNETAKAGAKKKLEDAGVSLSGEEPKKKTESPKKEPKAKATKPKSEPKPKAEPKKPESGSKDPYDCDDLIKQAKERKAKAKANAEKRANAPKKTPATKNKEAVEKTTTKVAKSVEVRAKKGEVKVAELEKLIAEYEEAIKKLKALLSKVKSGSKFAKGGNMGMMDADSSNEYHNIKEHHCKCGDNKMAKGGMLKNIDSEVDEINKKLKELENVNTEEAYLKSQILRKQKSSLQALALHYKDDPSLETISVGRRHFAKGGKVKERDTTIDREYRALKGGTRTSSKYASVEMRGGGVYHRRNANQYGKVKGGKTYTENRPNRTDNQPRKYLERGGNIEEIAQSIFDLNQRKGKIKTNFGDKTIEGLSSMIENENYTPKEIAVAILNQNEKNGKIATSYGNKTIVGLTEMIEDARK